MRYVTGNGKKIPDTHTGLEQFLARIVFPDQKVPFVTGDLSDKTFMDLVRLRLGVIREQRKKLSDTFLTDFYRAIIHSTADIELDTMVVSYF